MKRNLSIFKEKNTFLDFNDAYVVWCMNDYISQESEKTVNTNFLQFAFCEVDLSHNEKIKDQNNNNIRVDAFIAGNREPFSVCTDTG